MSIQRRDVPILTTHELSPDEARTQVAALCWRHGKAGAEVLLVTSRETRRWVMPKGWPKKKLGHAEAARQEAWEEAGAKGEIGPECIGSYAYHKALDDDRGVPCIVNVYPLKVSSLADAYPEQGQRERRWFAPAEAAKLVQEPELAELLAGFDPTALDAAARR